MTSAPAELAGPVRFEANGPLSPAWTAVLVAFAELSPLGPGRVNRAGWPVPGRVS